MQGWYSAPRPITHKLFVSYHHADQVEVQNFIWTFSVYYRVFLSRALGVDIEEDIIDSNDTDL